MIVINIIVSFGRISMGEEKLEFMKQEIDEKVGDWLTAHGISDEVQAELDYSDYDDELENILRAAKAMEEYK